MEQNYPFKIYDASAGSGKTFTIVKNYLKLLFSSKQREPYKYILAITFTNKAVGEMKSRVLKTLEEFADHSILKEPTVLFSLLIAELDCDAETLHNKSKILLNSILHNYGAFNISTIDAFNHKIIRTFAHDLKLALNFEVDLDSKTILSEAVDSLIAQAGTNKELTEVLLSYALSKADDDKSWNITKDLNDFAYILLNENDRIYFKELENKSLKDFEALKNDLRKNRKAIENAIIEASNSVLNLITDNAIDFNHFTRGSLPKHFQNLANKKFDINFSAKWQEDIEQGKLYTSKTPDDIKATIESIQPEIVRQFHTTKQFLFELKFIDAILKNITPLSVLNAINKELITLKDEQNKIFVSDFNTLIGDELKDQPTPFIYERLGEKYKHYFIDEFQDTSTTQWTNLIPLIHNNLSNNTGTTMLVGDAKQAIYRWRGGKAEQFLGLTLDDNPFQAPKQVEALENNHRSFNAIVNFNNSFFKHLATHSFSNETYSKLYAKSHQSPQNDNSGYVELEFIDFNAVEDKDTIYPETVYNKIESCLEQGFQLKDICVLVRRNAEASAVAEYLSSQGIKIASNEAMLLTNSPEVNCIVSILTLLVSPNNDEEKFNLLNYLADVYAIENKHLFFKTHINLDIDALFDTLKKEFNIEVSPQLLITLPLYELTETIARNFNLIKPNNAFVHYFFDVVFEFSSKHSPNVSEFLEFFDSKKDKLSIITPENLDAVRIMTIHKSKGLEFPVVIFPYAQLDIYKDNKSKVWYELPASEFQGFSYMLINYNKDVANFGEIGQDMYSQFQSEQELDNINLLYVTLTRPIQQLYIIGKKDINKKGAPNLKTYSGLLIDFLQSTSTWSDDNLIYDFGTKEKHPVKDDIDIPTQPLKPYVSIPKEKHHIKIVTNSGYLWDTNQEKAIEKGNLIHKLMASIKTINDIDDALDAFLVEHPIDEYQKQELHKTVLKIVNHPQLHNYYSNNDTVYNEHDIINTTGKILRPDRLNITPNNEVTIIDYKTGASQPKYKNQLLEYEHVLLSMHYKINKKLLVFINEDIKIEEV